MSYSKWSFICSGRFQGICNSSFDSMKWWFFHFILLFYYLSVNNLPVFQILKDPVNQPHMSHLFTVIQAEHFGKLPGAIIFLSETFDVRGEERVSTCWNHDWEKNLFLLTWQIQSVWNISMTECTPSSESNFCTLVWTSLC